MFVWVFISALTSQVASQAPLALAFRGGTLPASLGYQLPYVACFGSLQADIIITAVSGNWPDVIFALILVASKVFRVQEN